jgi:hypothetical protein
MGRRRVGDDSYQRKRAHRLQPEAVHKDRLGLGKGRAETAPSYSHKAVRDLLEAAFTSDELRRLFLYTENLQLRPLIRYFSSNDGLVQMIDRVIEFCSTRALLPDLLADVKSQNPRQYARFEDLLRPYTWQVYLRKESIIFFLLGIGLGIALGLVLGLLIFQIINSSSGIVVPGV